MSNPMRINKVPITLDRERSIVFDLNAFCALEEKFGSEKKAVEELATGSLKAVRTFLWAGLIHEDELLSEKQVGSMISAQNIQEIAEQLLLAASGSLPEAKN
ncbi:hypothetical protein M5X00_31165 [Paenibacillus alvei]|uniref:Phage tail tube protein, GTA-gp10 n=1 Tax=Paenibacillus alvei TaxID=44250 RepID=A0ABT4H723_PAEAL|nr:hypothetical protein [Paenibacillus alvei]EJW14217.1 hypothetical protein PAV_15c00060 [Paenibacillus alvei DSM 29]MCY9544688.1 hypothetical protein [Paenibacillus alvei]MCY9708231.1 hypothetical protein [Paenibacillus alvei]MCY9738217.1 hypothetical protein [Paenibacillus alvei]MCY9758683.1 hypothetical protein [Paenibacillus alvei]